ncbi:hypothetical protein A2619_00895, partial [candidate division WWE3 bacterium RIFOXYD1_FULL_39_9]
QKHLDTEIVVFDPYRFPDENDLTFNLKGGTFQISSSGRNLTSCDAVWFRKPQLLLPKDFPVDPIYADYTHSAYQKTVQALYGLLRNKLWVSGYWEIQQANNKLFQIEVARSLGMRIPNTIVTSVPDEASRFLEENGACVTKIMGTQHASDSKFTYVFYATRIHRDQVTDLSGLALAPAIFQQEVENALDVRVTVVGEKCFACEINKVGKLQYEVDWRKGITDNSHPLTYHIHALPTHMQKLCVDLVQQLRLKFGALDFLLDKSGVYWFLEINPNGQWGFVEEETGLPISKAMVELFHTAMC